MLLLSHTLQQQLSILHYFLSMGKIISVVMSASFVVFCFAEWSKMEAQEKKKCRQKASVLTTIGLNQLGFSSSVIDLMSEKGGVLSASLRPKFRTYL